MDNFRILIVILALLIPLSVTATDQKSLPVYTDAKPAIVVTADRPQFIIKLKSNPTTGFSWFLRDYDDRRIQAVKQVFIAATDKKLAGAPSYELWTFRVKPAGFVVPQQMMMRFTYARPWESGDSATQVVFSVTTSRK